MFPFLDEKWIPIWLHFDQPKDSYTFDGNYGSGFFLNLAQ